MGIITQRIHSFYGSKFIFKDWVLLVIFTIVFYNVNIPYFNIPEWITNFIVLIPQIVLFSDAEKVRVFRNNKQWFHIIAFLYCLYLWVFNLVALYIDKLWEYSLIFNLGIAVQFIFILRIIYFDLILLKLYFWSKIR